MDDILKNASVINTDGTIITKRTSKYGNKCASHLEILTGVTFEELPKGFDLWKYQYKMLKNGIIRVVKEHGYIYDMTFVVKPTKAQMDILRQFEEQLSEINGILKISIVGEDNKEKNYVSDGNWANTVFWILNCYENEENK